MSKIKTPEKISPLKGVLSAAQTRTEDCYEWAPLSSFDADNLPQLDISEWPPWLRDFISSLAAFSQCPIELAALCALGICSAACARYCRVETNEGFSEPTNLWFCVALQPGNRKSSVQEASAKPFMEWEREQAKETKAERSQKRSDHETKTLRAKAFRRKAASSENDDEAEDLAKKAADIEEDLPELKGAPRLWTSDSTPEMFGTLLCENDECIAWLSGEGDIFEILAGRYNNQRANLELFLKTKNGERHRIHRKGDGKGHTEVDLENPLSTVVITVQTHVLNTLANQPGFQARGLIARFQFLTPTSPLGYRSKKSTPIPSKIQEDYNKGIRALLERKPVIDEDENKIHDILKFSLEDGAEKEYECYWDEIEKAMRPGGALEYHTGYASKTQGDGARIAAVLQEAENVTNQNRKKEITNKIAKTGLDAARVFIAHSVASAGTSPTEAAASKLWKWIEQHEHSTFTLNEAHQKLRKGHLLKTTEQVKNAALLLEQMGRIKIQAAPPTGKVGMPQSPKAELRPELVKSWGK